MRTWVSKRKAILGIAFSFVAIISTLFHAHGTSLFQSLVDIFAGGRSTSKTLVFFIFLAFLYGIFLIQKNKKIHICSNTHLKKITLGAILFLGITGVMMLVLFAKENNLPLNKCLATFNNQEISSTCISHNHIAKGAVGITLKTFGVTSFESVDAGHAFLGLLPNIYFISYALILFLVVTAVVLIFIQEDFYLKNRLIYIPLYAALSFGTIEHIFDGGLGDPRTIVLYVLFIGLLYKFKTRSTKLLIVLGFLISFGLCFLYIQNGFITDIDSKKRVLLSLIAYIGCFLVPLILLFHKVEKKYINFLSICVILFTIPFLTQANEVALYRSITLDTDSGYIALYKKQPSLKEIDVVGNLAIYELHAGQDITIGSIVTNYKILDNILPVSVFWKTCIPSGRPQEYTFTLHAKKKIPQESFSSKKTSLDIIEVTETTEIYTYVGILRTDPCIPRILNILEEGVKQLGTETFFITNIKIKNDYTF